MQENLSPLPLYWSAIENSMPDKMINNSISVIENQLLVSDQRIDIDSGINILSYGKASRFMYKAAKKILGDKFFKSGLLITNDDQVKIKIDKSKENVLISSHPFITNLSEDALVDWIDRKMSAQGKLQEYLYAQATYLADGDKTIGDWLRSQEKKQKEKVLEKAERRQSGTNFDFTTMEAAELQEIDLETLTGDQVDAWAARMDELGL